MPEQELTIGNLFIQGGSFMWPILLLSVISVILIIERVIFYFTKQYRFRKVVEAIEDGSINEKKDPLALVAKAYVNGKEQGEEHSTNVATREATRQITQYERGIKTLATIGAIAPLVGLLGTVWGMVKAFAKIASLGDSVTAGDFADGIWTGLLTTVAGLIVAIPAVIAARSFEGKVDKLSVDLNQLASHLKELCFPSSK